MIVLLILMTGLMAGIYFAFSAFIMKSLSELPETQGAQAMNSINDVIVNTVFLPVFFGTTVWYAGLALLSLVDWQSGRSLLVVLSALIYIIGMFAVTAFGNVPLNNMLKESEGDESKLVRAWRKYLVQWTALNHIRTISCIASCALMIMAY